MMNGFVHSDVLNIIRHTHVEHGFVRVFTTISHRHRHLQLLSTAHNICINVPANGKILFRFYCRFRVTTYNRADNSRSGLQMLSRPQFFLMASNLLRKLGRTLLITGARREVTSPVAVSKVGLSRGNQYSSVTLSGLNLSRTDPL